MFLKEAASLWNASFCLPDGVLLARTAIFVVRGLLLR
jgi:hypothetical protein